MTIAVHLIEAAIGVAVRNYGASGVDNPLVDDTAKFNAAKAALPATGGFIFVSSGKYRLKGFDLNSKIALWMASGAELLNFDQTDNVSGDNYIVGVKSDDVVVHGGAIRGAISTDPTPDGGEPATYYCLKIYRVSAGNPYKRVRIQDVFIEGGRFNIQDTEAQDHWISGCRLVSAWDYGCEGPSAGKRFWFVNNSVELSLMNAGLRTGALSSTASCDDLLIQGNHFVNCGLSGPQDAIDISTGSGRRVRVLDNTGLDCADGIEIKVQDDGTNYSDIQVHGNKLYASSASYKCSIRVSVPDTGAVQDHFKRVSIKNNEIHHAAGGDNYGIIAQPSADLVIQDNFIIGPDYPIYLNGCPEGLLTKRPTIKGNVTNGKHGLFINGYSGGDIHDLVCADNEFTYTSQAVYIEGNNTGWQLLRPRFVDNRMRCVDAAASGAAMFLTGLSGALISGNDILCKGEGIRIYGELVNGSIVITKNTIDTSDGTSGDDCVVFDSNDGTVEIFDNSLRPRSGYRGWVDSAAGIVVLPGANCRGVWDTSVAAAPNVAGALGDFFHDPTPAAGATKWVATTAGSPATWTAQ